MTNREIGELSKRFETIAENVAGLSEAMIVITEKVVELDTRLATLEAKSSSFAMEAILGGPFAK